YSSRFADNVAFTRRRDTAPAASARSSVGDPANAEQLIAQALARAIPPPQPGASAPPAPTPPPAASPGASPTSPPAIGAPPPVNAKRLLEGTVIEAVLTNRLDGSFAGPLNALVTSPVYSQDRATVLVPSGARVLGTVAPVQAFGESRLAVKFHR